MYFEPADDIRMRYSLLRKPKQGQHLQGFLQLLFCSGNAQISNVVVLKFSQDVAHKSQNRFLFFRSKGNAEGPNSGAENNEWQCQVISFLESDIKTQSLNKTKFSNNGRS